jgi:Rod binding domain-containing protein
MGTSAIGPGTMSSQTSVQQAQESQMLQQVSSAKAANDTAKIEKGAKQFEAMLLSTWLQEAEKSFGTAPGSEDGDDEGATGRDQMMSLGVQSMSEAMANSGGIGIAKMIAKAMEATAQKVEDSATTGTSAAPGTETPARNLSFRLNSGQRSADSSADSEKRSK